MKVCTINLEEIQPITLHRKQQFEELGVIANKSKSVLEDTQKPELKQLPSHLKYSYENLNFRTYENARIYKGKTKRWQREIRHPKKGTLEAIG